MSVPWLKNFCGIKCTDYELLKVPDPKIEFTIHVTAKTVQCATFFGSVIAGPLYHQICGRGNMRNSIVDCGVYGALGGLLVGPVIAAVKINNMSNIDLFDRCYRLRFNKRQLNLDRTSVIGGILGAVVSGPAGFVYGVDLALLCNFLLTGHTPLSSSFD